MASSSAIVMRHGGDSTTVCRRRYCAEILCAHHFVQQYEISAKEKRNTPTVMRVKARRILREDGTYEYQQVTPVERAHVKSEK